MEVLGIDWGRKRVGLATGNSAARIASPLETWPNTPDLMKRLQQFCRDQQIATVVVGLPRGMEGQLTEQSKSAQQFAEELRSHLKLPVKLQDETLTTEVSAGRVDTDSAAAAVVLQDYLEQL